MTVINRLQSIYQGFIELNWPQKLLLGVVIMLTATFIFRTLTPEQAPQQPAVLRSRTATPTNLKNIEFKGTYPNVPTQLPTATIEYTNVKEELLQKILTAFDIPKTPVSENLWKGSQYQVATIESPELYVLTRLREPEDVPSNLESINAQTALVEATKIVDGLYSADLKPTALTEKIVILGQDEHGLDGGLIDRPFVKVPFVFKMENIPLYVEKDVVYAATITLDSSYELQKAEFRPYTLKVSDTKNYSTIAPSEAVARLNNNQGTVINYFYLGPDAADFSKVDSGIMDTAEVEYRVDLSTNTAAPYYKFSGVIKTTDNYDIESDVITPAIKTKFSDTE